MDSIGLPNIIQNFPFSNNSIGIRKISFDVAVKVNHLYCNVKIYFCDAGIANLMIIYQSL